jgi:transcription elongation factor Elf1
MFNCPNCNKEAAKATKQWKYGHFMAQAFLCGNCGTKFNVYLKDGKYSFTLKLQKGKGYTKV